MNATTGPRRVAIVTGSRAEYGLLRFLLAEVRDDARLELQVVVTGMHLSSEFGNTYRVIESDGFRIDAAVDMMLASDEPRAIVKSVGLATIGFADAFERLKPDIVVVLGDRFEILAAAQAAMLMRVPVAHLHGGELSEGAIDDSIRHAITKMAVLHFVAAEPYRRRVIQLGEDPARVFAFGAPGLDALTQLALLSREEVEASVGIELTSPSFLVTYHPVTLSETDALEGARALLAALDAFPDARVVVTKPNADASGRAIARLFDEWAETRAGRVVVHTSLGHLRYMSALKLVDVVVGNSSSGLIEAPAMRKPTVNIGPRQDGRLKADSVIDSPEDEQAIVRAIERALSPAHQRVVETMVMPYSDGGGDVSRRIKDVVATVLLDGLTRKRFYDIDVREAT